MAKKQQTPSGPFRTFVADGQGGWREATLRDLTLIAISLEWAANGVDIPKEAVARAAAAYDACEQSYQERLDAPLLDRAA